MFEGCDQIHHDLTYIHLKPLHLHAQKEYGQDHGQGLKSQLNHHLNLNIEILILQFGQLRLNG